MLSRVGTPFIRLAAVSIKALSEPKIPGWRKNARAPIAVEIGEIAQRDVWFDDNFSSVRRSTCREG
jgi:hypothetical protein